MISHENQYLPLKHTLEQYAVNTVYCVIKYYCYKESSRRDVRGKTTKSPSHTEHPSKCTQQVVEMSTTAKSHTEQNLRSIV